VFVSRRFRAASPRHAGICDEFSCFAKALRMPGRDYETSAFSGRGRFNSSEGIEDNPLFGRVSAGGNNQWIVRVKGETLLNLRGQGELCRSRTIKFQIA